MNGLLKLIILLVVFGAGFTLGQGHKLLDFNGDNKLTNRDLKTVLDHLTIKR